MTTFFGLPTLGIEVRTSIHLPLVQKGMRTERYQGHWLVYWLTRQLARLGIHLEPDIVRQVPNMVPGDALLVGNVLYCRPEQVGEVRAAIAKAQRP